MLFIFIFLFQISHRMFLKLLCYLTEVSCDMAHYTNVVLDGHILVETDVEEDHEKDNLQKRRVG
jgi:hypothetical protein